jgi:uncharacterized protein (TIGR02271 family)
VGAGLLAIPGIGPVLAAGPLSAAIGTTAATLGAGAIGAGIGAATGGLIGALVGAGVPKEEAEYYAEGVRRGGTLVTVSAPDDRTQLAVDLMQRNGAIDIDQRVAEWRNSGWTGFVETEPVESSYPDTTMRDRTTIRGDEEAVLPVVEEQVDVGKRQVDQGGVRVSTHVEERPVEEQVRLRDERVNVERRPVDRPVTDADVTAFKEASFEVHETAEEPVVRKRARVVEEVVIDKEVSDHTETVRDNVRRTDVSVDQIGAEQTGAGSLTGYNQFDNDYRTHYQRIYSTSGYTYDDYMPIYRYGHSLATNQRYHGRDWSEIEPDARAHWERQNPGTWDQYKSTVQYAWDRARGRR